MLISSTRSWEALAANLRVVARLLCPAAQQNFCTAAPQRRLPDDGRTLGDFIASASLEQLPPASASTSGMAAASSSSSSSSSSSRMSRISCSSSGHTVPGTKSVLIETYGCQMNVSDSEIISSVLAAEQYTKAPSAQEAGVVLLNTCAIRENAEARIWGRLGELQAIKKQRRAQKQPPLVVGVLGCMAERLKSKLLDQQRLADLVVGPDAYRDLPRIISAVQAGEARGSAAMNVQLSLEETYADIMPVRQDNSSTSAFVSIMRGCNNMCAFCIVPFTRGRERSRPIASILKEVEVLSEQGVKEVTLLGQNVNSYADFSHLQQQQQQQQQEAVAAYTATTAQASSSDRDGSAASQQQQQQVYAPGFVSVYKPQRQGSVGFAELLQRVALVNPEMRVRFTSPHPKDFTDDVLGVISSLPNVCSYLHMPAQSGSSSVLERMKRGYSREAYDALVHRARQVVPNVALSTDMIAGFCGETEVEHQASEQLLRTIRYDNAFIFSYSERAKTYAARHFPDDVSAEVKSRRLAELFAAYRQGQADLNKLEIGRLHLVLLDGRPRRDGEQSLQGRTCSMKRVIIPEQPLPSSLASLQQHLVGMLPQPGLALGVTDAGVHKPWPGMQLYAGPVSNVGVGDYVAVLVQRVVGNSTLLSVPLAKTSITEFAALLGSTVVDAGQAPSWLGMHGVGLSLPGDADVCSAQAAVA